MLAVANTGPAVSPAEIGRLLVPFQRGGAQRNRARSPGADSDGLGLGLPIVRAIATAHGAALSVAARPGGGLTARLALPSVPEARLPAQPDERDVEPVLAG